MTLGYALKLDLKICIIVIKIQNINNFTFETFGMVLANFQIKNKLNQAYYFKKTI